jgi:deazaflavin-dependent oxidoreductase (nitroreductase family)
MMAANPEPEANEAKVCYLTTTRRKTTRLHTIEIWFVSVGSTVYLISGGGARSDWVNNLMTNRSASVRIGPESFDVNARLPLPRTPERSAAVRKLHHKYASQISGSLEEWIHDAYIVALDRDER